MESSVKYISRYLDLDNLDTDLKNEILLTIYKFKEIEAESIKSISTYPDHSDNLRNLLSKITEYLELLDNELMMNLKTLNKKDSSNYRKAVENIVNYLKVAKMHYNAIEIMYKRLRLKTGQEVVA